MYAVGKLSQYITQGVYTVSGPFHPFGGAVDIIVVQQPDGSFKTSPWVVKFGKFQGVLKAREKLVKICVNGDKVPFHMYLDHKGEAHFLREVDSQEESSVFYLSSSGDDSDEKLHRARPEKNHSQDVNKELVSAEQSSTVKNMTPTRSNSRRNRFLGFVFGRRSMEEDGRLVNGERFVERISSLERAEIAADLLDVKWSTNIKTAEVISRREDASSKLSEQTGETIQESLAEKPNSELLVDVTANVATSIDGLDSNAMRNFDESVDLTDRLKHIMSNGEDFNVSSSTQGTYTAENFNLADAVDTEPRILNEVVYDAKRTSDECKQSSEASCLIGAQCLIPDDSDLVLKVPAQESFCLAEGVDIVIGRSIQGDAAPDIESEEAIQTPSVDASCATFAERAGDVVLEFSDSSNHLDERSNDSGEVEKSGMVDMSNHGSSTLSGSVLSADNFTDSFCFEEDINSEHIKELTMVQRSATIEGFIRRKSLEENKELTIVQRSATIEGFIGRKSLVENSDTSVTDKTQFGVEKSTIEGFIGRKSLEENSDTSVTDKTQFGVEKSTIERFIGRKSLEENLDTSVTDKTQFGVENFSIELLSSDDNKVVSLEAASTENASPVDLVLYAVEVQPKDVSDIAHDSDLTSQYVSKVNTHETEEHEFQIMSLSFPESQPEGSVEKIAIFPADDQILFEYVDNALLDSTQLEESRELDQDPLLCADDQFRGLIKSCDSSSHSEESSQESTARKSLFQDPVVPSSPIPIMQNRVHEEDVEELVKSSPSILDNDVFADNHSSNNQYLSRSLDSTSGVLKQGASEENYFETFSSKSAPKDSSMNFQISREENNDEIKAAFDLQKQDCLRSHLHVAELSLCRHLLSEGMGAEAAALAFDSEKMNSEKFIALGPSIVNNDKLVVRINGCYFPWESAGPIILGMASFGQDYVFKPVGEILVEKIKKPSMEVIVSSNGNWGIWPFSFRRSKTIAVSSPQKPDSIIYDDNTIFDSAENVKRCKNKLKKKVRAIVPTSEQLASLNLKDGRNIITFTFSTAMLGEQQVDANIYLWKWNSKIVVSDVDGTITKSDVLGQFMPLVGKDWSQTGVAHLFSAIKENGYELLFLSARAISQAHLTRQFLFNLKQDGKALPDGPVVISPDGLFPSLFREVIRRAPHEFKIACLEEIKALFPSHCNPFYAGFGNRNTDELSYLKVGIPKGKIFTINPKGEVAVHQRVHKKTYTTLHALVDDMFPATRSSEQEEYNSWNYWRISIPDIDI